MLRKIVNSFSPPDENVYERATSTSGSSVTSVIAALIASTTRCRSHWATSASVTE
jgi:hypothetical protein